MLGLYRVEFEREVSVTSLRVMSCSSRTLRRYITRNLNMVGLITEQYSSLQVEPPDRHGREEILTVHVRKKQLPLAPDVNLNVIAAATAGFTG